MKGGRRRKVNLVEAAVQMAGGVTVVARQLGVSRQAIYDWIAAGHMMNAIHRHVAGLSKLSGVPIEQLTREKDQSGSPD